MPYKMIGGKATHVKYSPEEVIKKSISLRSVMRSSTSKNNIELFKVCGFKSIYNFFKAYIIIFVT